MPKGGRRAKGKGGQAQPSKRGEAVNGAESNMGSDDDSNIDNVSVISVTSSAKFDGYGSDNEGYGPEGDNTADDGYYDDFEEKLLEALDATSDKSSKTRQLALEAIKKAFTTRYMYDFIADRKITVMDAIERNLKRGKGEEQGSAALLAAIVCVTLGLSDEADILFKDIEAQMIVTANDASVSANTRGKCATALSLCCFVAEDGGDNINAIMDVLLSVFSGSFLKGNGALPNVNPDMSALHSSCLMAWSLLLTVQPIYTVLSLTEKHVARITELLDSPDVDLRIAAGETIAVLHEISRQSDENFEVDNPEELYDKLRKLATDSQKFRAKKDRRVQRSSFRDILHSVEDGEAPSMCVKFGKERLSIDSWCKKRQYDAFCQILGSGLNLHLAENDLLRDIFELGAPLSQENGVQKISKFERHMGNLAVSKARTKTRGKLRDKRVDIVVD